MLEAIRHFVQQLLTVGGFRFCSFPREAYQQLLTAAEVCVNGPVVTFPQLIEQAKACPGCLIVDDTGVEKYGLAKEARVLFNHAKRQYGRGYKLLLFLWHCKEGYLPLGFAIWAKHSASITELTLSGFSFLRNHYHLKPLIVLADAYFFTLKTAKRLDDYGWGFIMRCKKNRKLGSLSVRQLIPRAYGQAEGHLQNGVPVQVIRRTGHFLATNRKLLSNSEIQAFYKLRWSIEVGFRYLKTTLKLSSCQQRTMQAQGQFITLCLLTFAQLQKGFGQLSRKLLQTVIFDYNDDSNVVQLSLFNTT
jgi:Transposase DDE domain